MFLGYSFNPVSFWYLYDKTSNLKAMILEVNNTFDERRIYFLRQDTGCSANDISDGSETEISTDMDPSSNSSSDKFKSAWSKDFHVSPFNSRKGSYSLKVADPFFPDPDSRLSISNVITLKSSKDHAKLVARIDSTAPSIDPSNLGPFRALYFITSWWWVGFVTFPRIVREAARLFFKRGLHVWYRPEVARSSIGRKPTAQEKYIFRFDVTHTQLTIHSSIESVFQGYLKQCIEDSPTALCVKYESATMNDPSSKIYTSRIQDSETTSNDLINFKPTTPFFYTNLALASHVTDFIKSTLQCTDPLKTILYTNHPNLVQASFAYKEEQTPIHLKSPLSSPRWLSVYLLRGFQLSDLDVYAMTNPHDIKSADYRSAILKLLVAKYLTFGFVEVLDLALWLVKTWLLWQCLESLFEVLLL